MPSTGAPPPGEPAWPLWERRTAEHEPEEPPRGGCGCPWLWVKFEDLTLYGLVAAVVAQCVDCGATWVREARE